MLPCTLSSLRELDAVAAENCSMRHGQGLCTSDWKSAGLVVVLERMWFLPGQNWLCPRVNCACYDTAYW